MRILQIMRVRQLWLPAVYENTSVVLNNNIIKPMEVVKFVQRNPYCQVLLYGRIPPALQELVVQEFELGDMGSVSVNWNCNVLRAMTSAFVKSVSDGEVALQAFSWARQMIDLYLIKHQISYDKRFEMAELYLATAKLLVDFLRTADQLDESLCRAVQPALQRRPAGLLHAADGKRRTDTGHPAGGGEF